MGVGEWGFGSVLYREWKEDPHFFRLGRQGGGTGLGAPGDEVDAVGNGVTLTSGIQGFMIRAAGITPPLIPGVYKVCNGLVVQAVIDV